ncbi:MAG: hypothetical protein WCK11_02195 [Candidatus Falkowbacteria bacterium]
MSKTTTDKKTDSPESKAKKDGFIKMLLKNATDIAVNELVRPLVSKLPKEFFDTLIAVKADSWLPAMATALMTVLPKGDAFDEVRDIVSETSAELRHLMKERKEGKEKVEKTSATDGWTKVVLLLMHPTYANEVVVLMERLNRILYPPTGTQAIINGKPVPDKLLPEYRKRVQNAISGLNEVQLYGLLQDSANVQAFVDLMVEAPTAERKKSFAAEVKTLKRELTKAGKTIHKELTGPALAQSRVWLHTLGFPVVLTPEEQMIPVNVTLEQFNNRAIRMQPRVDTWMAEQETRHPAKRPPLQGWRGTLLRLIAPWHPRA